MLINKRQHVLLIPLKRRTAFVSVDVASFSIMFLLFLDRLKFRKSDNSVGDVDVFFFPGEGGRGVNLLWYPAASTLT